MFYNCIFNEAVKVNMLKSIEADQDKCIAIWVKDRITVPHMIQKPTPKGSNHFRLQPTGHSIPGYQWAL